MFKPPFNPKIRHLFIDFDGTLVDSLPMLHVFYMNLLKTHGHVGSDEEFEILNGMNAREICIYMNEHYSFPLTLNTFHEMYFKYVKEIYKSAVKTFVGAEEFLKTAKDLGIKVSIVTSASTALVEDYLIEHGLMPLVQGVISGSDCKNGKPDPEIYYKALSLCRLKADQVLAFEDSKNGITAALSADINTVAMFQKHHPQNSKIFYANNWGEVLSWLVEE